MNKSTGMFFVASLSLILLTSTIAIPLQASAEPDTTKVPVVILFNDKVSPGKIDLIKSNGGEITRTYTIINGLAANLPPQAIQALENNPSVITVDPDIEFHALELDANNRIGVTQVQNHLTTPADGTGVKVAILDTGINQAHLEFNNPDRILLCASAIFYEPTCDDGHGHGTHVAGIVGANGDPNVDAIGAAYEVEFLIAKVLDSNGDGQLSGIIAGIDWAVANNADVINMSLGTGPYSDQSVSNCDGWFPTMTEAVDNAVLAGVSVVAAAGNYDPNQNPGVGLPACIGNTIAVAAVNDNDTIASFSSYGGSVEDHGISAPGVGIESPILGNAYSSWSGTSMATPAVVGTIALLLDQNPALSPEDVKTALFTTACTSSTCSETNFYPDTPDIKYGHGRVNAIAAYNSILGITPPESPDADGDNYTVAQNDCNDNNSSINPGEIDIPGNGIDEDCDGLDAVPEIHLGDLSATTSGKKNWTARVTITIHQAFGVEPTPISGVIVLGTWLGYDPSSCETDSAGQCQVSMNTKLIDPLTFTVDSISMSGDYTLGSDYVSPIIIIEKSDGGNNDGGNKDGGSEPNCPQNSKKPACNP